jgi:MYXO-CTERM domain-containing protein
MHLVNSSHCRTGVVLLALAAAIPLLSHGQIFVDPFDDGNDEGWEHYDPLGTGVYSFPGGNSYEITAEAPDNADRGAARAGSIFQPAVAEDFTMTVDLLDWRAGIPQTFGVVARINHPGLGTTTGYMLSYNPGTSAGREKNALRIQRLENETPTDLALDDLPEDLDPQQGYRMTFSGIGGQLSGSVAALDNLGTALGSVAVTDTTYPSGRFGLLVADTNAFDLQTASATFDNFEVAIVPEPARSGVLMGLAAVALAVARRRRPRQKTHD